MNKYQKEKSREIRDIMRYARVGQMTYKEAKREWRKGMRALPITAIRAGAAKRGVRTSISYIRSIDEHECYFTGYSSTGGRFSYGLRISGVMVRCFRGCREDFVRIVLDRLDHEMRVLCGRAPLSPISHFGGL